MIRRWLGEQSPSTPWIAAGVVFCLIGALLAEGPDAREIARAGVMGAIGSVVLLLAFSDRRQGRSG